MNDDDMWKEKTTEELKDDFIFSCVSAGASEKLAKAFLKDLTERSSNSKDDLMDAHLEDIMNRNVKKGDL